MFDPSDFFQCQMCGECCEGYGGTFVTHEDIEAISRHLNIDSESFVDDYCQNSGRRPLIKMGDSGRCVFWDQVCTIHEVKPRMCKLWPFIQNVVTDPANWAAMHSMCPGIRTEVDHQALAGCVKQVIAEYERGRGKE